MTTSTVEILVSIKRQLDWRGPTTRSPMHFVVLQRAEAEALYNRVLELLELPELLEKEPVNELLYFIKKEPSS